MYLATQNTTQELIGGNVVFVVQKITVKIKCNVKMKSEYRHMNETVSLANQ